MCVGAIGNLGLTSSTHKFCGSICVSCSPISNSTPRLGNPKPEQTTFKAENTILKKKSPFKHNTVAQTQHSQIKSNLDQHNTARACVKIHQIIHLRRLSPLCAVFLSLLESNCCVCREREREAMTVAAAAVVVPLGLFFFASGLVVNLIQAICYVIVRPLSKNLYRRINRIVAELLWLELVWIIDWWAGVKVQVFTDRETLRLMGKEHALVICNHRSDIDWLVGWVLAQRSGCLGSTLAVMKKSSKFLPVIGWSMWFSEYLFLERNWAKDESTLKSGLQGLSDYPLPFWLALFVEGTRFTQAKLLAAQEYATSTGLPVPRNTLIPRTKGFVSAVSHMRSFVPAIYDMTVAIPKNSPAPTMLRLFKGQPSVVHVHIKRHLMKDLPETDDGVAQWCRDRFVAKDALLDKHIAEDTFSDQELQDTGRPIKSLVVVISWACVVVAGSVKLLQWSSLLSSWKGVAFSTFALAIVTALMQILIRFSQSERSTPAKVVPAKPKNKSKQLEDSNDKQH